MNARSRVPVELLLMSAGYCLHPEFVTLRGGSLRSAAFPAGFACIRHPAQGWVLFDTGYSFRFLELTQSLPLSLYRMLTPVRLREEDTAVRQLAGLGIDAGDVRYVILSHFHADHIGGARDFPAARFLYPQEAYDAVRKLGSIRAARAGFVAGLLPDAFAEVAAPIEREAARVPLPEGIPFPEGRDLFGDGSLIAISLPGHAAGQIGLLLSTPSARALLCADAAWSSRALRDNRLPHPVAGLVMSDRSAYRDTFDRLRSWQQADPGLIIVPSHCREYFDIESKEVRRL
ncbi:MBL fold metallo-hydrolase [Paenibacillaceae bacterium WGS1546]|uniref:MBL fold metallo-hydrolase n=1 Tax=Cohnella sp. WGS1546 TaxID=3366810 RepID=UPI00372D8427